jgi:hypothetical protein
MTARLKSIFAATAALLTVGTVALLPDAVDQANTKLNCRQLHRQMRRLQSSKRIVYFVSVRDGYTVPPNSEARVIGNCNLGSSRCRVTSGDCPNASVGYQFRRSSLVNGWRLWRIVSPRSFVPAWRELATDNPDDVRFWAAHANVQARCRNAPAGFTNAQCRTMISDVENCWLLDTGNYCRDGLEYGPGLGGSQVCAPVNSSRPFPCGDDGQGQAYLDEATTREFPPDRELE